MNRLRLRLRKTITSTKRVSLAIEKAGEPLRVLLVNRALPAHGPGGLERHVHDLALGLAGAGCRVHLLSAPLPPEAEAAYAALGIATHPIACAHPRRYTLGYLLGTGREIERVLARHPIDIIHAQEFALGFWTPSAGAPALVVTVHGTITSETPLHPDVYHTLPPAARLRAWARYGRRFLYAPAWRRALARADRVLIDSAFTRGELDRLFPAITSKIQCVPLGVREAGAEPPDHAAARARLGWPEGQLHLLTTGRLEWAKGHTLALEALARLRDLPWHYTITGTGSYESELKQTIGRLGLAGRVTLAGWVGEDEKAQMLAGADLFLWPERTHPAFGLAGLEALLAGTPVAAARRGAIPEVLGPRGGWLVESPSAMASAANAVAAEAAAWERMLRGLLANPERLHAARAGLRQDALERFAFDKMIDAVLGQYRALLAE